MVRPSRGANAEPRGEARAVLNTYQPAALPFLVLSACLFRRYEILNRATESRMRILDLDLDFFLSSISHDQSSDGSRLSESDFKPWTSDKVREFLEKNCGLSTRRRVPGKYIIHHHEAFYWWRDLIRDGRLTKPFEVVHVDAHADLGSGMFGFSKVYVGLDLLHQPLEQRESLEESGQKMNAGNYLLVAIANRWLNRLVYVTHRDNKLEDCESWLFTDIGEAFWTLALPKLEKPKATFPGMSLNVIEREPPVEFVVEAETTFKDDGSFDFFVLCQSPGFTPKSSDLLVSVIQEYMDLNDR